MAAGITQADDESTKQLKCTQAKCAYNSLRLGYTAFRNDKDGKPYGILKLDSFSMFAPPSYWFGVWNKFVEKANFHGAKRLELDVIQNGGGSVAFAYALVRSLHPSAPASVVCQKYRRPMGATIQSFFDNVLPLAQTGPWGATFKKSKGKIFGSVDGAAGEAALKARVEAINNNTALLQGLLKANEQVNNALKNYVTEASLDLSTIPAYMEPPWMMGCPRRPL